jgi:hypothetical protein
LAGAGLGTLAGMASLLEHGVQPVGPEAAEGHAEPEAWWKVMCLTRVDCLGLSVIRSGGRRILQRAGHGNIPA